MSERGEEEEERESREGWREGEGGKERRRGRELLILAWISLKTEGRKTHYLVSDLQK